MLSTLVLLLCFFCHCVVTVDHVPRRGQAIREEPADDCWSETKREIEQEFDETAETRAHERKQFGAIASSKDATPSEKSAALSRLLGLALAESLGKFNHKNVVVALKDDCKKREQAINDPCTTVHYDAEQDKCIVITQNTPECRAERQRRLDEPEQ